MTFSSTAACAASSTSTAWAARSDGDRIAGSGSWLHKTLELIPNVHARNLVEVGPRGMHERAATVRALRERGATFFSGWDVRRLGVERVCEGLGAAYEGASRTFLHIDMDVVGGSGSSPAEILGDLAEPLGLTDYEVLRIAYEVGQRGVGAATFVCIPPGSPVMYRLVVYAIMYMLAGLAATRAD